MNKTKTWTCILSTLVTAMVGRASVGDVAQNFTLPFFDPDAENLESSEQFELYELEGTIVVLEWFGWWCPFCPPASEAFETQVLGRLGSTNQHGVSIEHVALHVDSPDANGIVQFGLDPVVMDVRRTAFRLFSDETTQPFFVILNGVENAEGIQQWEILFEVNGYGGITFPASEMIRAINRVQSTEDSGPGGSNAEPPATIPEVLKQNPFQNLPVVGGFKNTDFVDSSIQGLGWVMDVGYPNIYSHSLQSVQTGAIGEREPLKGWLYIYPDLPTVNNGLLAYDYYSQNWIWIPNGTELRQFQVLSNPSAGLSGWRPFPATTLPLPTGEALQTLIGQLVVPASPPVSSGGSPFIGALGDDPDLTELGYPPLGTIQDEHFPRVFSEAIATIQSGENAGWIYIQPNISSANGGLLLYLYGSNQWAWVNPNQGSDYFAFSFGDRGANGWNFYQSTSAQPSVELVQQITSFVLPEPPFSGSGNPFASLPTSNGIKDASPIGDFGWINDNAFPNVYDFSVDAATEDEDDGWLYVPQTLSDIAGGVIVYRRNSDSWLWIPRESESGSVNLSHVFDGNGGWSSLMFTPMPSANERNRVSTLLPPGLSPGFGDANPFEAFPVQGGVKNIAIENSPLAGFGWIEDSRFPFVYSWSDDGQSNLGWVYIVSEVSDVTTGILLFSYTNLEWRWYPSGISNWYLNLTRLSASGSGWLRFEPSDS